jgi:hypothetical protein
MLALDGWQVAQTEIGKETPNGTSEQPGYDET